MNNPLDIVGEAFQLSLMNPNPKARRLKDGPRFFLQVEVDKDTFDLFMGARDLAGMVIECEAQVSALNSPVKDATGSGRSGSLTQAALAGRSEPWPDGTPPPPVGQSDTGWKKLGPLCQSAIELCKDADFQEFAYEMCDEVEGVSEEAAERYLKTYCQVGSRKELDQYPAARERFTALMDEYRHWLNVLQR